MEKSAKSLGQILEKELIFYLSHRKTICVLVLGSLFFGLALEGRLFQTLYIPILGIIFAMMFVSLLYFMDHLVQKIELLEEENGELEKKLATTNRVIERERQLRLAIQAKNSEEKSPIKLVR